MVRASATPQAPKPLEVGAKLRCRWRDQGVKACEVIERKQNEDTGDWQYYIHCAEAGLDPSGLLGASRSLPCAAHKILSVDGSGPRPPQTKG